MKITDKYVFFWNGIYSQWYPSKFTFEGVSPTFNCAEQYMMFRKAMMFKDTHHARIIMETDDPQVQKKAGRLVQNFDQTKWDEVCQDVVFATNLAKFSQNPKLKEQLLIDGKGREFVEASPYDKIWGIGMGESNPFIEDKKKWCGKNYLGIAITKVYEVLK
jgi:ribA/ribD-fused uncharacterized protein